MHQAKMATRACGDARLHEHIDSCQVLADNQYSLRLVGTCISSAWSSLSALRCGFGNGPK